MGATKLSENQFKYLFLSVKEEPNFYILANDSLDIFKSNVIHAFYFIIYILDLHYSLYVHKVMLIFNFDFAVNSSNNKNWRFRLDNVSDFIYYEFEDLYRNHYDLINNINRLLKVFNDQTIVNFLKNLMDAADKLKDSNDKDYFTVLTNMVEYEVEELMENTESMII